jgi:hypothetical protein
MGGLSCASIRFEFCREGQEGTSIAAWKGNLSFQNDSQLQNPFLAAAALLTIRISSSLSAVVLLRMFRQITMLPLNKIGENRGILCIARVPEHLIEYLEVNPVPQPMLVHSKENHLHPHRFVAYLSLLASRSDSRRQRMSSSRTTQKLVNASGYILSSDVETLPACCRP